MSNGLTEIAIAYDLSLCMYEHRMDSHGFRAVLRAEEYSDDRAFSYQTLDQLHEKRLIP